jgi:hypothetical protein
MGICNHNKPTESWKEAGGKLSLQKMNAQATDEVGRVSLTYLGRNETGDSTGQTCEYLQTSSTDLGKYYIGRMQETMEEWYSKPRQGQQ